MIVPVVVAVLVAVRVGVRVVVAVACAHPITVGLNVELLFAVLDSGIVLSGFTTAVLLIGEVTTHGLSINATI